MLSAHQVEVLLDKLCIRLGFCLPPDPVEQLKENPPSSVIDFTNAVFTAEEMDSSTADRHLYRQVRDMVAEAFRKSEDERGEDA
jgi:hypothetical protein